MTPEETQFGELSPRYNFIVNPYPDQRMSRCPICEEKTGQRKLPLIIHVDPLQLVALNYTNRYCRHCDLLIAHRHEVERLLTDLFRRIDPAAIGNDYLILGTLDKKAWRKHKAQPHEVTEMRAHIHDFKTVYQELRISRPGWYKRGQTPPIAEPPPSEEWIKGGA